MRYRKVGLAFLVLSTCMNVQADLLPTSFSVGYGWGAPNSLIGYRAAVQWDWPVWFAQSPLNLTGYWDLSYAYWNTAGNARGAHKSINILGFAPVFRLQPRDPWFATVKPYAEASIGLAAMSATYLGQRNLGAYWSFQDLVGVGFMFGKQQQFDLSYHYLHYSNANFAPPNAGIDVLSLITFRYRFG